MAKYESTQHRIDRNRAPRVHITYDVEVGDATVQKELPFVVGVMADLSGKLSAEEKLPKLEQRKFVDIDAESFDKVMAKIRPRLAFQVDNAIQNDGSKLSVDFRLERMDDFRPENVAMKIEPLRKLLETRKRLQDLLDKTDGNDKLEEILKDLSHNRQKLDQLRKEADAGLNPNG